VTRALHVSISHKSTGTTLARIKRWKLLDTVKCLHTSLNDRNWPSRQDKNSQTLWDQPYVGHNVYCMADWPIRISISDLGFSFSDLGFPSRISHLAKSNTTWTTLLIQSPAVRRVLACGHLQVISTSVPGCVPSSESERPHTLVLYSLEFVTS